jgi:hypothetical protein
MFRKSWILLWAGLFFVTQSFACPVCFKSKEGTREAFLWTTVMLSLLPLGMIGGAVYAIRVMVKKQVPQNDEQ